jgi:hypothetical protein
MSEDLWLVALICVLLVPLWIILFWIPRCDTRGIMMSKSRSQTWT